MNITTILRRCTSQVWQQSRERTSRCRHGSINTLHAPQEPPTGPFQLPPPRMQHLNEALASPRMVLNNLSEAWTWVRLFGGDLAAFDSYPVSSTKKGVVLTLPAHPKRSPASNTSWHTNSCRLSPLGGPACLSPHYCTYHGIPHPSQMSIRNGFLLSDYEALTLHFPMKPKYYPSQKTSPFLITHIALRYWCVH